MTTPTATSTDPVESPCVLICSIDDKTGWCFGCARTGDEIMGWINMSEAERAALVAEIPGRMAKMDRPARKLTKRRERQRQRTSA